MAEIVLPIADTHIGSKLGLLHPETKGYKQNDWQKYTWKCWQHMLATLPKKIDALILMDEMIDGPQAKNHKYSTLITEPKDQRRAAQLVLEPLVERTKDGQVWMLIGSSWHVGEWGTETHNLAEALGAHLWENEEDRAGYNLFIKKGPIIFDFAHSRSVVMVNRSMPLEREMRYRLIDDPLPRLAWSKAEMRCITRAHSHDFGIWHDRHGLSVGLPCWQGMYFDFGVGKRAMARVWKDIGWLMYKVDEKARHPLSYDYELYDYPKASVWDMEEERWIKTSRNVPSR